MLFPILSDLYKEVSKPIEHDGFALRWTHNGCFSWAFSSRELTMWKPPRWLPFPVHSVESREQKHIAMLSDSGDHIGGHMSGVITKLGDMLLSFEENEDTH